MTIESRRIRLVLGLVAAFLVLGGAALCWRAAQTRETVLAAVPARPNLEGFAPELKRRLDRAEQRAKSFWGAVGGLRELARLYHANGFLPQATACERGLLLVDARNAVWPYLLAHTAGSYGDLEEALPLLRRALELDPGYTPARIRLGDALLKSGDPAAAAAVYREILANDPRNGYAVIGLARTELAGGGATVARDRLLGFVGEQPAFEPAWGLLINIDEQLGDEAAAAVHRSQARSTGRSREMADPWVDDLMDECYQPYRLAVAASAADPADKQARARKLLERAIDIAPSDDLAHRLLGNLLSDLGELSGARIFLERAAALNPKEPDNWSYLVQVLKAAGDPVAAGRALTEGLGHCPEAPALLVERGRRLVAAGLLEDAAVSFERSRALRPEESSAYVELALVRFKQDRLEDGIAKLREAVKVDPNHPVAVVLLARYAISTADESEAKKWIARARQQTKVAARDMDALVAEYRAAFGREPL